MTVEQVAEYLQLNKLTIYRYIRTGELPAVRIGRALRVLRPDVEAFLEAHRVRPAARQEPVQETRRKVTEPAVATRTPAGAVLGESIDVLEERRRRQVLLSTNPLEWVIRGLH
ncbi:MAG: helix-turn-helix domain-containing protein [Armatimonadota bacterium]|nr:helix-turn-helix domain-containing protein [Armatimonadota bacterium]MDR7426423.1 helix-turn-helix domain-containing protein [Armatimonadota bacterium]MDR7464564.1 helix-turn-helix domain-containing protein [Armatimonadota bacterium]MDR7540253.1 helix-turn-helix domain-containing protein [Armatimonadota bacterium]